MDRNKSLWPILGFNCLYLTWAGINVLSKSNMEFVIYVAVILTVIFIMTYLYNRFQLPIGVLWLMSFWGLFHMAGGLVHVPESWPTSEGKASVLYNLWLIPERFKYDQAVHAYGFGVTTWLIWEILRRTIALIAKTSFETITPSFGLLFVCVIASMGLGAFNEVIEFMAVLTVPETNVGGYVNTGWDLVFNMLGAVAVAFAISISSNK